MSGHPAASGGVKRKKSHDDHGEEHPDERWLVTYADMLTLLLVLFIVLYAMSVVDTTKFQQLRAGLATVFEPGSNSLVQSSPGGVTSTDDGGSDPKQTINPDLITAAQLGQTSILDKRAAVEAVQTSERAKAAQAARHAQTEVDQFKKIQAAISKALAAQGLSDSVRFGINSRGLVITVVTSGVVFGGNSATLLGAGRHIIDAVVPPLLGFSNGVEVDGHTNQDRTSTAPYPSGWELSSARASAVVRYMISSFGFAQSRLSAVGFSDQRPLYPPSDPRASTLNRRVEIVVLSKLADGEKSLLPTIGGEPTG
jgi:chemotaxis protein MotB